MTGPVEKADNARPEAPLCKAMAITLKAYTRAGHELVEGAFAGVRDLAPPNFRVPCHVYVVCCPDGVLVRYDAAGGEEPKVQSAEHDESLTKLVPLFSEYLVHIPDDPATYAPQHLGPSIALCVKGKLSQGRSCDFTLLLPLLKRYLPDSQPHYHPNNRRG